MKKISKFGPRLLTKGGSLILKALMRRHLGDEGLDELKSVLDTKTEEEITKELGSAVENLLTKQTENELAMEAFRASLESTIRELTSDLPEEKRKLIIFVDELDRCRPNFAVETLESIKHFFAVQGIVFILGIDERQIANSMSSIYGSKLDTDGYLRRFIDWRFRLPEPLDADYAKHLSNQFRLGELSGVWRDEPFLYHSLEGLLLTFGVVSEALSLSLRQQEQNFTEINLLLRTLTEGSAPLSCVTGVLVPLRSATPELFDGAFAPQPPGSLKMDEARRLFSFLRPKLTAIGGLKRLGAWSKWADFEGCFLAWFIDKQVIKNGSSTFHVELRSFPSGAAIK